MTLGLGMFGLEEQVEQIVLAAQKEFSPLTYIEIGVANGGTLAQVAKILARGKAWRAIGVELPNGYSFHKEQVEQNCTGQHLTVDFIRPNGWTNISPVWNRTSVVLTDSRDFFQGMWGGDPIHLALIDGCHCRECATADFKNVEKFIVPGGTVLMHDFEPDMHDVQRRGHGPCDVPVACKELGIMDKTRPGWDLPRILAADHSKGGGNMLAITRSQ